jgi:hypothetical protein
MKIAAAPGMYAVYSSTCVSGERVVFIVGTEQNGIEECISTLKWKQLIAPKCLYLFTRIHVIAFQKAQVTLFIDYTNLSIRVK